MTAKGWAHERLFIFIVVAVVLLMGIATERWLWCAFLGALAYNIWQLYQSYQLRKWLNLQVSVRHAPHLYGVMGDIASNIFKLRKNHQRSRRQMQRLLRLFDSSAQNSVDATLVLGAKKEIVWLNKAAQQEFLLRKKKDIGVRITHVFRDSEFEKFIERAELGAHLTIESPQHAGRYLDLCLSPYRDGGLLLSARDITNLVLADKTRRDFVTNASHELKTPLTVMMGYLEILQDEPSIDAELVPIIYSAALQAARMHNLVNDLLCLSRLESKGNKLQQKVKVAPLIRELLHELSELDEYKSHPIEQDLAENLRINAAPKDLISAFSNLIMNALLHTKAGTPIKISWQKVAGNAVFAVRDYGYGIEPEHLPRISERFYRVEAGRERDDSVAASGRGTGLGLAIVKHVMQAHGGRLEVSSVIGKGSEFRCVFAKKSA